MIDAGSGAALKMETDEGEGGRKKGIT